MKTRMAFWENPNHRIRTPNEYVEYLKEQGIQISMDSKGRALNNIYIERFWRTIEYQHIYLNPAADGQELYQGISKWLVRYHNRKHQGYCLFADFQKDK